MIAKLITWEIDRGQSLNHKNLNLQNYMQVVLQLLKYNKHTHFFFRLFFNKIKPTVRFTSSQWNIDATIVFTCKILVTLTMYIQSSIRSFINSFLLKIYLAIKCSVHTNEKRRTIFFSE